MARQKYGTMDDLLVAGRPKAEAAKYESLIRRVFDTVEGRLLVNYWMANGPHPMAARFSPSGSAPAEAAAFSDGQKDVIGHIYMHSGITVMTPTNVAELEKQVDKNDGNQ